MPTTTAKPDDNTVHQAWSAVMSEISSVGKDSVNEQQRFKFRGIDAVMNAAGPAMRKHGVMVIPVKVSPEFERYDSRGGASMRACTVTVDYRVYGPRGDYFEGQMVGEAADSGDKSVSKAESVAYRQFLLQSLTLPTDDPDPDAETHEAITAQRVLDPRIDVAYKALEEIATGEATPAGSTERDAALAAWNVDHADVLEQVILHKGRNITLARLAKQVEDSK